MGEVARSTTSQVSLAWFQDIEPASIFSEKIHQALQLAHCGVRDVAEDARHHRGSGRACAGAGRPANRQNADIAA